MPTISYTLTTEASTRFADAMCGLHNYPATVPDPASTAETPLPDIANPETKAAFAKRKVKEWMIQQTKRYEEIVAKRAAETSISSISIT